MIFTHDTELVLSGAAALVNTAPGSSVDQDEDQLRTIADLADFYRAWGYTGRRDGTAREVTEVQSLRPRLRAAWHSNEADLVMLVNTLLAEGDARPQVVEHDGSGWHIHATRSDAPFAVRISVEIAMALSDVLRAGEVARLKTCASDGCQALFLDLSKNRSRRFCGTTCGNRESAAAYRARRGGTPSSP